MNTILVFGFGRSGTTWVSDIISKTTGQILLFEPDHPCVFDRAEEFLYQSMYTSEQEDCLLTHINDIQEKKKKNSWLIRNHLLSEAKLSPYINQQIWSYAKIGGFKSIRWISNMEFFLDVCNTKILFVIRHPLSVISSLINRPRFFEEFGWSVHWEAFENINLKNNIDFDSYRNKKRYIKYALLWCYTNIAALQTVLKKDIYLISYEDLYLNAYDHSIQMMNYLGYSDLIPHPSSIFYPSMSSLKTNHHSLNVSKYSKNTLNRLFWKATLSDSQAKEIIGLIKHEVSKYPSVEKTFDQLGYLKI